MSSNWDPNKVYKLPLVAISFESILIIAIFFQDMYFLKKPVYLPIEFPLCWIWLTDGCWFIYLFLYPPVSCKLVGRTRGLVRFRFAGKNTSLCCHVLHFSLSKTGQVRLWCCQPDPTILKLLINLPDDSFSSY